MTSANSLCRSAASPRPSRLRPRSRRCRSRTARGGATHHGRRHREHPDEGPRHLRPAGASCPGVQDTNLNRDFAQWRSAISITINGMPSQNKDVRVDGINIVDEGGCGTAYVNLNMDAIGEVQVISNGYTAENGRNNGGVISIVDQVGHQPAAGLGLVQRPPRPVQRERLLPQGDQPGQAALPGQHFRLQRRRPGGDPRLDRQPERHGGQEDLLLRLAGIHRRRAADDDQPRQHADGAEFNGDFSQTFGSPTARSSRSSIRSPASRSRATSSRRQAAPDRREFSS